MPEMHPSEWVWAAIILVLVYAVRAVFILKACCAVTDVREPGYLLSFLWSLIVMGVVLGSAWLFGWLFGKLDADPNVALGTMRVTGVLFSLVVSWGLVGLFYWLVLATTPFKGFWVAALELLLTMLVASLLFCVYLVGRAIDQLTNIGWWWEAGGAVLLAALGIGIRIGIRLLIRHAFGGGGREAVLPAGAQPQS